MIGMESITPKYINQLAKACTNLHSISIDEVSISEPVDELKAVNARADTLRLLKFYSVHMKSMVFAEIGKVKIGIRELYIGVYKMNAIQHLCKNALQQLNVLSIEGQLDATAGTLSYCIELHEFHIDLKEAGSRNSNASGNIY